jgi:hypothetical protein
MLLKNLLLIRVIGLWLAAGTSLFAVNFQSPAEGPVAFRRDKIPLDSDTMASLSRHLVILAQNLEPDSAVHLRTAAQMLALATTLDPANTGARDLLASFEKDEFSKKPPSADLEKIQTQIWQCLSWLQTPEAGNQGQALAACLTDIMLVCNPENPRVGALRTAKERGAWAGWIPELAAYQSVTPPVVVPPDVTVPNSDSTPKTGILLSHAQVATLLWKKSNNNDPVNWSLYPSPIMMTANEITSGVDNSPNPFSIIIGSPENNGGFVQLQNSVIKLLTKQHGSLPQNVLISINSDALQESQQTSRLQSISAAVAVLSSAALTGQEPNSTIIGTIDEKGAYKLPTGFWEQLMALASRNGKGNRLILPTAAAGYLPSLLTLDYPQFFLNNEVILASNFNELLAFSAKNPDESLAKINKSFQEIQDKSSSQPLGQYISNTFVRRRLMDIAQEAPYHYSAKMLVTQASGNRPAFLTRVTLIPELRHAIEPMLGLLGTHGDIYTNEEIRQFAPIYELCRSQVDKLARYTVVNDRDLGKRVEEMLRAIRTLDKTGRAISQSNPSYASLISAHAALVKDYQIMDQELTRALKKAESDLTP